MHSHFCLFLPCPTIFLPSPGELSLLRIWPFTLGTSSDSEWLNHFWTGAIKEAWDRRDRSALRIVHELMTGVCMRHSRLQQRRADGSLLVDLPPRTEKFVAVAAGGSGGAGRSCFILVPILIMAACTSGCCATPNMISRPPTVFHRNTSIATQEG